MLRTTCCLITGANRGIGLEFVRQIINLNPKPINVIATCRNPDKAEVIMIIVQFSFLNLALIFNPENFLKII